MVILAFLLVHLPQEALFLRHRFSFFVSSFDITGRTNIPLTFGTDRVSAALAKNRSGVKFGRQGEQQVSRFSFRFVSFFICYGTSMASSISFTAAVVRTNILFLFEVLLEAMYA